MPNLDAARSHLLLIDFQDRLVPAIHAGAGVVAQAGRVLAAARLLDVPRSFTEQVPAKLGATVPDLAPQAGEAVLAKVGFDAGPETGLAKRIAPGHRIVVAGCEAHGCVLQTVLGLLANDLDSVLARMERRGRDRDRQIVACSLRTHTSASLRGLLTPESHRAKQV